MTRWLHWPFEWLTQARPRRQQGALRVLPALAIALSFGGAAYACDCQKNQQEQAKTCTCGAGQSCPGECNHEQPPQKPEKKKSKKAG